MDLDVVATIEALGWHDSDVIPALYLNGILKRDSPVICSRWGIEFMPEDASNIDPRVTAIHESGHAIIYIEYNEKFQYIEIDKHVLQAVGYNRSGWRMFLARLIIKRHKPFP